MQHSASARLRLRRACSAAAVLLVLLPLLSALTIGLFGLDPMQGIVAVAQALGAGGDGAGMDGAGGPAAAADGPVRADGQGD